ncbi:hypothetical protein [Bradyrhizobium embrapense]|uniref:hypothetical protein n=1 Tax=Bradyrhizobium embrapense TaxID=630921 RepID=UPI000AD7B272|nr:hypothetical protein [Bradyrhizobium embrapense]
MKLLLLGTIGVILLVAAVGGLAVRLRERSGSDIGLNRGDGRRCWEFVDAGNVVRAPPPALTCPGATGSPLGGEIGFRWQIAKSVPGIAMNGNCASPEGSNARFIVPGLLAARKIVTRGPVEDPLGYAWKDVLLYAKAATAAARNKYQTCDHATPLLLVNASDGQQRCPAGVDIKASFCPACRQR